MFHQKRCGDNARNSILMRAFSVSFLVISSSTSRAASWGEPIESVQYGTLPPHLTLRNFQDTLFSSIDDIFEYVGIEVDVDLLALDDKNKWWANYTSVGWDNFFRESNEKSPFIACHDGEDMSGHSRSVDVINFFSKHDAIASPDKARKEIVEKILFNTEELTCLYIVANPLKLVNLPSHETEKAVTIAIQPVRSEMKAAFGMQKMMSDSDFFSKWWGGSGGETATKEISGEIPEDRRRRLISLFSQNPSRFHAILCDKLPAAATEKSSVMEKIDQQAKDFIESALDSEENYDLGIGGIDIVKNISPEKCRRWLLSKNIFPIDDGVEYELHPPILSDMFNGTHMFIDWIAPCAIIGIASLVRQMEVCNLAIRPDSEMSNTNARYITQGGGTKNYKPFYDIDIRGDLQIVAVSDTGLDINSCYFRDTDHVVVPGEPGKNFAPVNKEHRKVVQYVSYVDSTDYSNGHGTHVSGSIVGLVNPQTSLTKKVLGFGLSGYANGIAENAKISFFDIGDTSGGLSLPRDPKDLLLPGYEAYALVHSASWGNSANEYGSNSRAFDEFQKKRPEFLILVAAGNSGDLGLNSVGDPAIAKNIIAVGASESMGQSIRIGQMGKDYLAAFSSRGPTADGRIKPDVVAPGHFVNSAAARPDESESCTAFLNAGTSMATPVTSGNALLVRQYFDEGFHVAPAYERTFAKGIVISAALLKAVLINGAQYLVGVNDDTTPPPVPYDTNQGFGRISLLDSLPLKGGKSFDMTFKDRRVLSAGQKDKMEFQIDTRGGKCESKDLSATLVWTDEPARSYCKQCLMNDLDMKVLHNGLEKYPNGRSSRDSINNVERVRLEVYDDDVISIEIKATTLASEEQDYAFVMTGCFKPLTDKYESKQETIPPAGTYRTVHESSFTFDWRTLDWKLQIVVGVGLVGVVALVLCFLCKLCC
uniref:subtilisin n=1 Tax=Corethron hystrix TaxID=216773 RepID=A0A7S1G2L9_9STRA|mmetsp:Transcript_9275/g.20499  ORF Transcript_9275/g.20499 Transcript_9275/m.20499 type:complete len:934 (+) Transcript_9275:240-3041(+)